MSDFNLKIYNSLLSTLKSAGYTFLTYGEYMDKIMDQGLLTMKDKSKALTINKSNSNNFPDSNSPTPIMILRHDVDKLPKNSLEFAIIQYNLGIKGSYYFRMVPESFDEKIIRQIADLGHEIGYHYEDMDLVRKDDRQWTIDSKKKSENTPSIQIEENRPSSLHQQAIELFEKNLSKLREIAPINTICMHGSPRSPIDNKELWKYYDYRDYGIIGEPYFDIDFSKVAYYTDTGRMWDGDKYSVRDRVNSGQWTMDNGPSEEVRGSSAKNLTSSPPQLLNSSPFPAYHSTQDIITSLQNNTFPKQAMLTFHPQRWTNKTILWTKELFLQSAKNIIKKYFFVK